MTYHDTHFSLGVNLHCLTKCEDTTDNLTQTDLQIPRLNTYQEYYETVTIGHVRKAIKRNYKIPEVCQIQVLYSEGPIVDDTLPLSHLHFKQGDNLDIFYYATAKVDIIDEILADIDSLTGTCQRFSNCYDKDVRTDLLQIISDKESFLRSLTFIVFLPWNTPETEAGKLYFVSQGGLDKLMGLLKWTVDMGPLGRNLSVIVEFEKDLFLSLWGFADTLQEKLLLLNMECLQLALRVLTDNIEHNILVHHALGLTQMLVEIPGARQIMIDNPKSILKIAECLEDRIETNLNSNDRFPEATIICRLSHSCESHKILTQKGIFQILLEVLRESTQRNGHFFLKYLLLQFFMNVLINPRIPNFSKQDLSCIEHMMTSFLALHKWNQLYQYETKNGYNCSTIVPFIHALFVPKHCQIYTDPKLMSTYLLVTIMSLKNVLNQPNKQELFIQQELQDFLTIACWYLPQELTPQISDIMSFYKPDVPSLQNITITKLGIEKDGFHSVFNDFRS
ncbi:hypothetical protein LOD99_6791 [Oopsacas minuta]|uniref:Ubiquitin-like domain-containing protein n=1 Tax=Oopsacas minuta TaxID=111878 RepID=A0AAV7JL41_9METZ|nr:hypothetical protein LOD99_6791 [Oopsacas minuta]